VGLVLVRRQHSAGGDPTSQLLSPLVVADPKLSSVTGCTRHTHTASFNPR
jgi:hypothetical protein